MYPQIPCDCHFSSVHSGPQKIKLKIVKLLLISVLSSFLFSLFFLSSVFATMFALPNGDFRKLKTLQHILSLRTCTFVSS
jgi:hypothetical protein